MRIRSIPELKSMEGEKGREGGGLEPVVVRFLSGRRKICK